MTNFFKVILFTFLGVFAIACNQSADDVVVTPPKPYAEQEPIDDAKIKEFFTKFHLIVSPYDPLDDSKSYNVNFRKANDSKPDSLSIKKKYLDTRKMIIKKVIVGGVEHNLYYLPFVNTDNNNGMVDSNGESISSGKGDKPTVVDSIKVCYRVRLIDTTSVDNRERVPEWFSLRSVYVQGWREVFPLFGAGDDPTYNSGLALYTKYGAGIMFLPSALAYYNRAQGNVPAYAPLIFNFKLVGVNYSDDDYDRIDSRDEAYVSPGVYNFSKDTDGDGRPDYLDQDDDGDGVTTKDEIRRPRTRVIRTLMPLVYEVDFNGDIRWDYSGYYKFDAPAGVVDNNMTPDLDESKGIPNCSGNGTNSSRLRKHLDKTCQ